MRSIITQPVYRALKTLAERKSAFNTYIEQETRREKVNRVLLINPPIISHLTSSLHFQLQEEQLETEKKVREDFINLLSNTSAIRITTRYRKAAAMLEGEPAWGAITSERYRQALYDDYIHELSRKEKDELRELRKQSMDRFAELLRSIPEITHRTTWKAAQELYSARPEYADRERFKGMDKLDFLVVFEDHVKHLEQVESDQKARVADARKRTYRKHRDAFKVSYTPSLIHKSFIFMIKTLTQCCTIGTFGRIASKQTNQCKDGLDGDLSSLEGRFEISKHAGTTGIHTSRFVLGYGG